MTIPSATRYLAPMLILAVVTGCGKPGVKISAIDGRVREVTGWSVVWSGEADTLHQALQKTDLAKTRSRFANTEPARQYVEKVSTLLRRNHSVPTDDNFAGEGVIMIDLRGRKIMATTYPTRLLEDKRALEEEVPEIDDPEDRNLPPYGDARNEWPLGPDDYVDFVEVTISRLDGQLLGSIMIGRDDDHKVAPDFVAKVIAEAIRSGRY